MKPHAVIQRGYGGAKFDDFAVYCKRIIYPHTPKAVVIFVANDITGGEQDKTPKEVLTLYQYVVKQIRKKLPNEPVFFIQITPTNSRWKVWNEITEANNLIKTYSETDPNLHYIETAEAFLGADGKPKGQLFRDDQLHLNLEGYKIWSGIILENVNKAFQ
jgi:lysophospholipase L1-like esterase